MRSSPSSTEAPLVRLLTRPDEVNGLNEAGSMMVDKITTVPRARLDHRMGRLADEDLVRLGRAIVVFLGLAGR